MSLRPMVRSLYGTTVISDTVTPIITPAVLFGVVLDLLLFGVLTTQVYIYYLSFPKDRIILKVAVAWVYLVGVTQTGLALVDLFASVFAWGSGPRLDRFGQWETETIESDHFWVSITLSTSAVAIVIQSLYAYRIYLISQRLWLAILIICMSFCQFASGIFGAICYSGENAIYAPVGPGGYFGESACRAGFTYIWGPVNVSCDLTITICMVTFLLKHRTRTISHQTHTHITGIVQIVVETGMATTVVMVIYAALFFFWSPNFGTAGRFFPLPGLMMSKLYSNSMLVLLNNRMTVASGSNTGESVEFVEVSRLQVLEDDAQLQKGAEPLAQK